MSSEFDNYSDFLLILRFPKCIKNIYFETLNLIPVIITQSLYRKR